jgi:hypothetical protein
MTDTGCTPLHTIVNHSVHSDKSIEKDAVAKIITELLDAKADPQLLTKDGKSVIDLAGYAKNTVALEVFHARNIVVTTTTSAAK